MAERRVGLGAGPGEHSERRAPGRGASQPGTRAVFRTSRSLGDRLNQRLLLQSPQPILMLLNRAANSRMNCTYASPAASSIASASDHSTPPTFPEN